MATQPVASIVLPFRNSIRTLDRCLQSIVNQDCKEWELIAVNDHSSDGSEKIIEQYSKSDTRILLLQTKGEGIVDALNYGISKSKSEIIVRMDSDDRMYPHRVHAQIKYLEANPKTGEIFTKETNRNNIKNRFVFKVERGLQRESTEIFISNEVFNGTSWNKNVADDEYIKSISTKLLNGLSELGSITGTSLVALNLNTSDKIEIFVDEDGFSKIRLMVNFPRAWTALQRTLSIAEFTINDFDREAGIFLTEIKSEVDFFGRGEIKEVKILVEKIAKNETIISVSMEEQDREIVQEIISQINQVLS